MPEFLKLSPPIESLNLLLRTMPDREPAAEKIDTAHALGRVLAEDIRAPHPLPEFSRSAVDGYAVRARDTFGASESMPGYLTLTGEVNMGAAPAFTVQPGACALIHTGGMIPPGADAVVMLEYTQTVAATKEKTEIEVARAVAEGENVIRLGEDVAAGQVVLAAGERIRPAMIGGCMAIGFTQVLVAAQPKIGIISSGDEVVEPSQRPAPGQVRDVNSYSLAALIAQAGGEPVQYGIVSDSLDAMKSVAVKALAECDALLITAGSSASARDTTADAIRSLGAPGVLVHGVSVRPGKPTILAVCDGKAVIGLPGNPVSALVIAGLFVVPVIERLLGMKLARPRPSVRARLMVHLPSQAGREDWAAVRLTVNPEWKVGSDKSQWLAEPVFGKSNLIFSLAVADGLVRVEPNATGISAGEVVDVALLV
jgi:molybdopterin molybdotransferase